LIEIVVFFESVKQTFLLKSLILLSVSQLKNKFEGKNNPLFQIWMVKSTNKDKISS